MTIVLFLAVVAGGLFGAPARYVVDQAVSDRVESELPWGTLAINVSGSVLLGLITGLALHHHVPATVEELLGTGFCGAYTTFSTFSFETVRLVEEGRVLAGLANVLVSVVVGLLGAAAGIGLGLAL